MVVVVMSWYRYRIGQMTEEALNVLLLVPLIKSPAYALMPYYLLFNNNNESSIDGIVLGSAHSRKLLRRWGMRWVAHSSANCFRSSTGAAAANDRWRNRHHHGHHKKRSSAGNSLCLGE